MVRGDTPGRTFASCRSSGIMAYMDVNRVQIPIFKAYHMFA